MRYQYGTQNDIPEPLREHYEEHDGTFRLKVEDLPEGFAIENVTGLKNALKAERGNAKTLAERLAELEGGNATEHKKLAGKVDHLAAQNAKLLTSLNEERLANATTEAIYAARGNPALLRPVLEKRIKIGDDGKPQVIDDAGQPLLNKAGEPVTVRDFVLALRELPQYQGAFAGTGNSGSGTPPSRGNGVPAPTKTRSKMTVAEKAAYIKEHGTERFMQIPPV